MKHLKTALIAAATLPLMAFTPGEAWDQIEGRWAIDSADNCSRHYVEFTYDYPRDRNGDLEYINNQPPARRDRLATVMERRNRRDRANVGPTVEVSASGESLYLEIRRATLLPFNLFGEMGFEVVDNDTIRLATYDEESSRLARALGGEGATLYRCSD